MNFFLTEKLQDTIFSAMENQKQKFLVDAGKGILIEETDATKADNERYYELPKWTSFDGFNIRKEFAEAIRAPFIHDELQTVLHSGRGVFRNFKNVLKQYPEYDRKWHLFKTRKMRNCISLWYNELCEIWGLESLNQEYEETEDLVLHDFVFKNYDSNKDKQNIQKSLIYMAEQLPEKWSEPVKETVLEQWKYIFEYGTESEGIGFSCTTASGQFIGCITASPCPPNSNIAVILTSFFVLEEFRSLGIGKELFSLCISDLKKKDFKWVFITDIFLSESMQSVLRRTGFEKIGSGFVLNLSEK